VTTKRLIIVVVVVATGLLLVAGLFQPAYIGPGVRGNLIALEVAKARWLHDHKSSDEWPTKRDLQPYFPAGLPHSVHGEIYIVNKVGDPVYAYDPKTERSSGLDLNGLNIVKDYLEQTK
jgi:hypothetical protein